MSVTVKKIAYNSISYIKNNEDLYELTWPTSINILLTKNKKDYVLNVNLSKGFKSDGASVPTIFSWFLPKWDTKNMTYNCGSMVHDCLYTASGCDNFFTREDVDDILRGIWRNAGISRFKAGVADVLIGWFGGGKKHWGSDNLNNKKNNLVKIDIIPTI